MIASWAGAWLRHAGAALVHSVFVPRCGACDSHMCTLPLHRLCHACDVARIANDGLRCHTCDAPGSTACARCTRQRPAFARLRAPWLYGGVTAEFIRRGKFHGKEALIEGAAYSIIDDPEVVKLAAAADCIVPVPLGNKRLRQRGFNQSSIIAQVVGRAHRRPVRFALRRVRDTVSQSALTLAERAANVQQAFAPRLSLSGTALLVDDVVTSGETVSQAARALLGAGVRQVTVLAVARAPDPSWNQEHHV